MGLVPKPTLEGEIVDVRISSGFGIIGGPLQIRRRVLEPRWPRPGDTELRYQAVGVGPWRRVRASDHVELVMLLKAGIKNGVG